METLERFAYNSSVINLLHPSSEPPLALDQIQSKSLVLKIYFSDFYYAFVGACNVDQFDEARSRYTVKPLDHG